MMRLLPTGLALPALLLLAACGGTQTASRSPAQPEGPEVAACREEARTGAAARDVSRQANPNNVNQTDRLAELRAEAQQRAFNDCLRRRGLVRGGGVEAVRRPGLGF